MARPDTWMPFYGDDYQADTGHCSAVERGAYSDLLWACWKRKNSLPKDDAQLMRLARCTPAEWKQAKTTALAFFTDEGDHYSHKRVGIELAIATARYERKVAAGQAGGKASGQARAKQTGSNRSTTVQAEPKQSPTQIQLHSSIEESTDANASVRRARKPRRTRLADDWKPSEADRTYARGVGLTDAEIDAAGVEFSRYWRSADAAGGGLKADWHATWCGNIDRNAATIVARRPRGQQSRRDRQEPGSIVDLANRLKARADLAGSGDGRGMGWGGDGVPLSGDERGDTGAGDGAGGIVIDADDAERMHRLTGGDEAADEGQAGAGEGPGGPTCDLRAQAGGIPGGRGSQGADDAAGCVDMVAGVGGIEGAAGPAFTPPPQASGELEDWEVIPQFLRRA